MARAKKVVFDIKDCAGEIIEQAIGSPDGAIFDLADSGATFLIKWSRPSIYELTQIRDTERIDIRMVPFETIIMMTAKIGTLGWMDMPYSPNMSVNMSSPEILYGFEGGMPMRIVVCDTRNGMVKAHRMVKLSCDFSNELIRETSTILEKPFSVSKQREEMGMIFRSYSPEQLAKMSKKRCFPTRIDSRQVRMNNTNQS